ncbi:MAG: DUF4926 domain-containing protein [Paenibacillaceae bacterium]|nr:DUF4926 domain-containing protein [Paenibacillaceae bacterium]
MELYKKVRLLTDTYSNQGAQKFDVGYIIEFYPGGKYEIEFSDPETGITYAQIVARQEDFEVMD